MIKRRIVLGLLFPVLACSLGTGCGPRPVPRGVLSGGVGQPAAPAAPLPAASVLPPPPPPPAPAPGGASCGVLSPGQSLNQGQSLSSCDGFYTLIMQADANLVLYRGKDPKVALWCTQTTNAAGPVNAAMQGDGNFVVYGAGRPLFSTSTAGHPGAFLAVQGDGNLTVYDQGGKAALWASNTAGK